MKIIINVINVLVLLTISTVLVIFSLQPLEKQKGEVKVETKQIQSESLVLESNDFSETEFDKGSVTSPKTIVEEKEEVITEAVSSDIGATEVTTDVLETQVGKMSGYGPDCRGCSGYLASGSYVGDGTIYYSDAVYGQVRILAGDAAYPFGTIVRIKDSRVSSEFIGIVLDRGGAIGFGKKFLFDLLYPSEQLALKDEVSYNTTFEILRFGYK